MYTDHFKLRELPFRLTPDPQFLYLSKNHARAKAYMESTIWFTDGFVVITGEIGAGKTTLIETFLRELEKDVIVAQIHQTQVSTIEFLQGVLVQFGFTPFRMKKAELLATLNTFLIEQYAEGRKVLLIVDEAQNLSLRVLEEIRLLSGVETTKEKVLRIILAGQPELNEKLDSGELIQLAQRVRLRFHLTSLTEQDLQAYVLHRLEVAGSSGRKIFDDDVFPTLFHYTGGVPRLVNTLAETSMMAAFANERDVVIEEDVQAAIRELQWLPFADRMNAIAVAQRSADRAAAIEAEENGRPPPAARATTPALRASAPASLAPTTTPPTAAHAPAPTPAVAPPPMATAAPQPPSPLHERTGASADDSPSFDPGRTVHLDESHAVRPARAAPAPPAAPEIAPAPSPASAPAPEFFGKIIIVTEGETNGEIPLRLGRTVIGRTPDNDLQIDSRFVSRHHCQVITTAEACVIEDLNSTNGIVVKSKRVRHHNLNDGDVVTIGKHELIYVDERKPR